VKTTFKLKINIKRNPLNFKSILWNHLQAFPIWWDYPFKQCCQPAEISAAVRKCGPRKISAAEKTRGRISRRIPEIFEVCLPLKILDNLQHYPLKSQDLTDFFFLLLCVKESFIHQLNEPFREKMVCVRIFFCKWPNFSVDLCQELATLVLKGHYHKKNLSKKLMIIFPRL
jgi:hypothetical protein